MAPGQHRRGLLAAAVAGSDIETGSVLAPAEAHRILLHCALDAAGISVTPANRQAVADIAGLDFRAVNSVIGWLAASPARI